MIEGTCKMNLLNLRKTDEKTSLDILHLLNFCKGIGIIWVFLTHYQLLYFGWQGVHLFVFLSGFGLTYSRLTKTANPSWKFWYFKRFRRILPTYLLVAICGYFVVALFIWAAGNGPLKALWLAKRTLLFDVSLLKNFNYEQISTFPNVALWFVPFILSFYLIFPLLYRWLIQQKTVRHLLSVLLITIVIEIGYRAVAINWLDGYPIGYSSINDLFPDLALPLNNLPDNAAFPFQQSAPFGFFPSRVGEFTLGMVAAIFYVANRERFNQRILSIQAGVFGFLIWLAANVLITTGFWGWVVGDLLITIGLTLWILGLAALLFSTSTSLFKQVNQVGIFSYYIFLCHAIFIQAFITLITKFPGGLQFWKLPLINVGVLLGMIAMTAVASQALQRFDRSSIADWLMQRSIGRALNL
jgi:peptidoglycan/LPS O-acetylase OafA/YrhL